MVAKHVLSAGNGCGKDPAARSFLINSFSLSRSKEATRSNSKLVGPSDCQGGDDGVELKLRSDPAYCSGLWETVRALIALERGRSPDHFSLYRGRARQQSVPGSPFPPR